jgi:hypothetical protein
MGRLEGGAPSLICIKSFPQKRENGASAASVCFFCASTRDASIAIVALSSYQHSAFHAFHLHCK